LKFPRNAVTGPAGAATQDNAGGSSSGDLVSAGGFGAGKAVLMVKALVAASLAPGSTTATPIFGLISCCQ
jgi:hypothetical protein